MAHFLDWVYLASTLNQPLFAEGWGDIFQMKALSPQGLDEIEGISMTSDGPWTAIPNGYFKHVHAFATKITSTELVSVRSKMISFPLM